MIDDREQGQSVQIPPKLMLQRDEDDCKMTVLLVLMRRDCELLAGGTKSVLETTPRGP